MSSVEREPSKRKIKPPSQPIVDLEEFGESSDDSDFNIDDHHEASDDDSFNTDDDASQGQTDSGDSAAEDEDENDEKREGSKTKGGSSLEQLIQQASLQMMEQPLDHMNLCCACLGDRSDTINEVIECDSCGVSVHEGCYGVTDALSISSTESLSPTEPWFCEPCRAGVKDPLCELCPNSGGIFKATDVGRWVHLVCALYVPGVAFGEVEKLTNVTLFEMPYNKWGAKACCLCEDDRLARTGVHIPCDAGMCRTHFHVTCAQREGLLSEAHSEEVDQADPFYAHCKLHTDKTLMRRRRRNYIVMQARHRQRTERLKNILDNSPNSPDYLRIQKKLAKQRDKFLMARNNAPQPWVPTQKMPRLLTTSAWVCRELWRKAELMGIDTAAAEYKETRTAVLSDISRKWHIPPAFSLEFTGYFLDRINRIPTMKDHLQELLDANTRLTQEQEDLNLKYEAAMKSKDGVESVNKNLKQVIDKYHGLVRHVAPDKRLPVMEDLMLQKTRTLGHPLSVTMMVPTAAALKAGVGYPILRTNYKGHQQTEPRVHTKHDQVGSGLSTHDCGICHTTRDQHLLTKCDTCHLHYHLGCLSPPLTRMPKKTKQMGWQCSECDRDSSGAENAPSDVTGPRQLRRSKYLMSPTVSIEPLDESIRNYSTHIRTPVKTDDIFHFEESPPSEGRERRTSKKRRRDKHERYSPVEVMKKHKKKKKTPQPPQSNLPRIKIKIKAIPNAKGEGVSAENTQMFVASSDIDLDPLALPLTPVRSRPPSNRPSDVMTHCDTCCRPGDNRNLVRCDECRKCFHFACLDPPVKKSPKMRGYSWHCADCDPTESDH